MKTKSKLLFSLASVLSLALCVVIATHTASPVAFGLGNSRSVVWHHYNKKLPTQSEKGIKEYWVQCGGNYQFTAPTSGTIIDKGSNYDTTEFTDDDSRWLLYCEEYGHSLDSFDVCSSCGELMESSKISNTAIDGSSKITSINPVKGFENVYQRASVSRGAQIGSAVSASTHTYFYFALMQSSEDTLYVYGGDSNYASLSRNAWTYFLLVRGAGDTFSLYTRSILSSTWENKTLDTNDAKASSLFSNLRFYNWVNTSYTVYCSELYVSDKEVCSHTFDAHNICTKCMKSKNSIMVADYAVSGSTVAQLSKPSGFNKVHSVTGKSNGANGVNLDISNYNSLYFALYADIKSVRPFSGGDDEDGSHRIVWSGRWWYLLVEKVNGMWNGYIKEAGTAAWYTRTIDQNTTTNFSNLLLLYNWEETAKLSDITIYSTEIYASKEAPQVVEKEKALNIGVWNGSYHFTSTASIDDLANAGFTTTIGINPTWNSNWNNILDYSAAKGIKHIVDPRGWDSQNGCYADWTGTAPSYATHSAVEGFILADEPNSQQFSSIAQTKQTFKSVMPSDKKFFVNLLSSACGLYSLYGTNSATASYSYYETNYANAYHNTVNPDVYSFDSYPLFTNGEIRKPYFCNFDIWSNMSRTNSIPTWYSLLSAAHDAGDGANYAYVLPTQAQLEWQMSCAISFGITNLMHYLYATDASDYSCMANIDGTKNAYFNTVSAANNNMRALDDDLINYDWEGTATYHNLSKVNLLFQNLKHTVQLSSIGISSVNATSDCLIGSYINQSNNRAYMVTNSGYSTDYSSTWADNKYTKYDKNVAYVNEANTVNIMVNNNITGADIIQNGVKTHVSASNNTIAINLAAYGSAFVIPTI